MDFLVDLEDIMEFYFPCLCRIPSNTKSSIPINDKFRFFRALSVSLMIFLMYFLFVCLFFVLFWVFFWQCFLFFFSGRGNFRPFWPSCFFLHFAFVHDCFLDIYFDVICCYLRRNGSKFDLILIKPQIHLSIVMKPMVGESMVESATFIRIVEENLPMLRHSAVLLVAIQYR